MKLFKFDDQHFIAAKNKTDALKFFQRISDKFTKVTEVDPSVVYFYDDKNNLCNAKDQLNEMNKSEPFLLCCLCGMVSSKCNA